jgi:hypothetical protein
MMVLSLIVQVAAVETSLSSTTVGPFGLAFPHEATGSEFLSCEGLRGRPFVTGLHVQQLIAPLGGRTSYEFRVQCGPALSKWTDLGPSLLMWSGSHRGSAICPRPQSMRGLHVTRGRNEASRADLFGFTLVCGAAGTELLDIPGLAAPPTAAEQRGRQCSEGAFVSALNISRGYEPEGGYDLFEFELTCSEVLEPPPPPPPEDGYVTRGFRAAARGDGGSGSDARDHGSEGGGGDSEWHRGQDDGGRAPRAHRSGPESAASAGAGGGLNADTGRHYGGRGGADLGGGRGSADAAANGMEGLRALMEEQQRQRAGQQQRATSGRQGRRTAGTAFGEPGGSSGAAEPSEEQEARLRTAHARMEENAADAIFGRVRASAGSPTTEKFATAAVGAQETPAEEVLVEEVQHEVAAEAGVGGEAEVKELGESEAAAIGSEEQQGLKSVDAVADPETEQPTNGMRPDVTGAAEVVSISSEDLEQPGAARSQAGATDGSVVDAASPALAEEVTSRLDSVMRKLDHLKEVTSSLPEVEVQEIGVGGAMPGGEDGGVEKATTERAGAVPGAAAGVPRLQAWLCLRWWMNEASLRICNVLWLWLRRILCTMHTVSSLVADERNSACSRCLDRTYRGSPAPSHLRRTPPRRRRCGSGVVR